MKAKKVVAVFMTAAMTMATVYQILCLDHPYLYTDDHSAKLPVCLCRRADCPGMSKDRTCALRYQKISFCDQCSCPAFFLWCKSGFF